jgi:hypothetical protein
MAFEKTYCFKNLFPETGKEWFDYMTRKIITLENKRNNKT